MSTDVNKVLQATVNELALAFRKRRVLLNRCQLPQEVGVQFNDLKKFLREALVAIMTAHGNSPTNCEITMSTFRNLDQGFFVVSMMSNVPRIDVANVSTLQSVAQEIGIQVEAIQRPNSSVIQFSLPYKKV